jgi:sugar phosphate isomerase/epimerase
MDLMPVSTPDLLASCWTTAGDAGPMTADERSPFRLRDRIETAARTGYTGFGIVHADLVEARAAIGYPALRSFLAGNGIRHVEVEFLDQWHARGAERARSDAVRADLLQAAERLGARHIKVGGDITSGPVRWDEFVADFWALCQDAADSGTRIAFEPVPFGNVADLAAGRRLIDAAGHPAGGLMLDLWHMARGGSRPGFGDIAALPGRYVFGVELDDADADVVGSLLQDTLHRRRLCGEGAQDVTGFIRAVSRTGFGGPWGVEILSDDFRKLSLRDQVTRSYETTAAALRRTLPEGTR